MCIRDSLKGVRETRPAAGAHVRVQLEHRVCHHLTGQGKRVTVGYLGNRDRHPAAVAPRQKADVHTVAVHARRQLPVFKVVDEHYLLPARVGCLGVVVEDSQRGLAVRAQLGADRIGEAQEDRFIAFFVLVIQRGYGKGLDQRVGREGEDA